MKRYNRFMGTLLCVLIVALVAPALAIAAPEDWTSFRGHESNMALVNIATPRTTNEAKQLWKTKLKNAEDWGTNVSDPLIVDGTIYVAVGNELRTINSPDGKVKGSTTLAGAIDFTCRPIIIQNMIVVPISDGRLQAFSIDSLAPVWTSAALPAYLGNGGTFAHQTQTTLIADSKSIYMGTACADWSASYYGVYQAIDIEDGNVLWTHTNPSSGYYWSGAVCINDAVFFAGDDGILQSVSKTDGTVIDSINLGTSVRSTIVANENQIFVTTTDGKLHKVTVLDDGTFGTKTSMSFAASSTSSPVIYNDVAYVGGGAADYTGVLCAIETKTMKIKQKATSPGAVYASSLLSIGHENEVYAYFTSNCEPGALYTMRLGDSQTEASALFTPAIDDQNYCMSSPIADNSGTLYYTNDSGNLFAIAVEKTETPKDPTPDNSSEPKQSSDNSSGASSENPPTGNAGFLTIILLFASSLTTLGISFLGRKRDAR